MNLTKLRVGVFLDSIEVPGWLYHCLQIIQVSDYAEVKLVLLNDIAATDQGNCGVSVLRRVLISILRLGLHAGRAEQDALVNKDASEVLSSAEWINVRLAPDTAAEETRKKIRSENLDVLINGGRIRLPVEFGSCARYGTWEYSFQEANDPDGQTSGFWDVIRSSKVCYSWLCCTLPESGARKYIYCANSRVDNWSVAASNNNRYWKLAYFVPRKLRELYLYGEQSLDLCGGISTGDCDKDSGDTTRPPPTSLLFKSLLRRALHNNIERITDLFYFDQWGLMYRFSDEECWFMPEYREITPPKDRFWADPHVLYKDGKYHVFFEEYIYRKDRGRISMITLNENGDRSEPVIVLEEPYHISYPFVFEHENAVYMIPESSAAGTIDLYKCRHFPDIWEFQMHLMTDVFAVDTTVIRLRDKWWMFTCIAEDFLMPRTDELYVFSSDELYSADWKPHHRNPVISDVKNARPAGSLFEHNGDLFRISQDNSMRYGYGFDVKKINKLSEDEYQESVVNSIRPGWNRVDVSTHTFNRCNRLSVIDVQTRRLKSMRDLVLDRKHD